jgi:hypothetical protein
MPIWHVGKRREALTGNSEVYKKQVIRYLEKKGFYLKASSDVEGTFADCILTRKGEEREYWLEAKATMVSLGDSSFLSQLGKYFAEYVLRTPISRFRLMITCYRLSNLGLFDLIFDKFESSAIENLAKDMAEASEVTVKEMINSASRLDIKQFFEDTIIIEANPAELQIAETKVSPIPPVSPSLSDAEYAAEILKKFGDVEPSKGSDKTFLSLFQLTIPSKLYIGETPYVTGKSIFDDKPNVRFPAFHLENGQIFSFDEMNEDTLLGEFVDLGSCRSVKVEDFSKDVNNTYLITKILNRWIRSKCKRRRLKFDEETHSYYHPKKPNDDTPISVTWMPRFKHSVRELTKPMITNGKVNYWVHRAAEIFARRFWGNYYIQIRPRFLFSPDGTYLFEGWRRDKLDRAFRKSIYNRNLNKLYDVLFWYRYVFPEANKKGNLGIDSFFESKKEESIRILEQIEVETHYKPNIEIEEEVEQFDKLELATLEPKTLDDFL